MKYLFLIFLYLLSSCTHQRSTDNAETIPVLNIGEKDYPTRKINIHDIADVEYIPLESSDSTLLGLSYMYFSDKYVVASDDSSGGNIYFF